jgi:aromatic ring-opening dioxygenase LigB subunit
VRSKFGDPPFEWCVSGVCTIRHKKKQQKGFGILEDRQQRQVNEAAEKFAAAIRESFEAVAERGVSAQQLNAELTQSFFNNVIDNLRAQTEANRALTRELAEQQERQMEATQVAAQDSVDAYMDFMNSMFSYYQGTVAEAQRQAGGPQR